MKSVLFAIGRIASVFYPYCLHSFLHNTVQRYLYSGWIAGRFKSFGKNSTICPPSRFMVGKKYVSIGENVYIGIHVTIAALDRYNDEVFQPEISIGNNCCIGDEANITSVHRIKIGNGVRLGKRVLITDNAHGASVKDLLQTAPHLRPIYSKGPVVIEDNVFIGEKVSIMPGVTIGTGAIIGANSVITKDVPPYCVVTGEEAKIQKRLF